ncbi:NUDIX domain-containing protein [Aerococcaceae bacterium zg-B36]|uniref:NUDIX hydrolase n=1 Tax=Aerococcaceae bacterium zg-252 TaxID=2796928 RepID=UPI001BD8C31B|nr:NUDIX domain-containing protein [Aerococcaceae bacterium zg-B36]
MDFRVITNTHRYGVRVTALIMKENKLLCYKVAGQHHLVGGAINVGEASYDAVIREVREELGLDCSVQDLMFVVENRFDFEGELHHMIEFHYKVAILGEAPKHLLDGEPYECEWVSFENISNIDLRPKFLKEELPKWNGGVRHIETD